MHHRTRWAVIVVGCAGVLWLKYADPDDWRPLNAYPTHEACVAHERNITADWDMAEMWKDLPFLRQFSQCLPDTIDPRRPDRRRGEGQRERG